MDKIRANSVIQGDCLEIMKGLPDKSIDLLLADPPYGIGNNTTYRKNSYSKITKTKDYGNYIWNNSIPSREYFDEMFRVSKNQIIWGANYFMSNMPYNSSCWIVWDKDNLSSTFADCELAWTSFHSAVRKYRYRWNGMLQENMKNKEVRYHPTQKPIPLFSWILKNYSKEGDTILDPFTGSGTTALACIKTNRNYICIEKEPEYVEIINKRIKLETDQFKLAI